MKIKILDLENNWLEFDLSEVGRVFEDDDIIYFNGIPCILSSAGELRKEPGLSPMGIELLDALKAVLATTEPRGDGSGCCAEGGPCVWHKAYSLVCEITGDTYGEWMDDFD